MDMADARAEAGLLTLSPGGVTTVGVLMPIAASIAVTLRFYARRWQRLSLGYDDWAVLAASCLVGVLGLILIVGSAVGALGQHTPPNETGPQSSGRWAQSDPADGAAEKIVLAYSIVEKPAFSLTKISVLLLYRRVFKGAIFPRVTMASCVVLAVSGLTFLITSSLQCPTRNWESWDASWALNNRCVSQEVVTVGYAFCDMITDILIVLMPLPVIYNLGTTGANKAGIFLVLISGLLPLVASVIRLVIVCFLAYNGAPGYRDLLAVMSTVTSVSLVEAGIAVVAACIPTLRNLIVAGIGSDMQQGVFESGGIRIGGGGDEAVKSISGSQHHHHSGLSMITEESEPYTLPTRPKGPFGGAYPLQKISDAASSIAPPPSRGTEKSVAVSETEDQHSVLRHYDQVRQCWQ